MTCQIVNSNIKSLSLALSNNSSSLLLIFLPFNIFFVVDFPFNLDFFIKKILYTLLLVFLAPWFRASCSTLIQ